MSTYASLYTVGLRPNCHHFSFRFSINFFRSQRFYYMIFLVSIMSAFRTSWKNKISCVNVSNSSCMMSWLVYPLRPPTSSRHKKEIWAPRLHSSQGVWHTLPNCLSCSWQVYVMSGTHQLWNILWMQTARSAARCAWRPRLLARRNTRLAATNAGEDSPCKRPTESAQVSRKQLPVVDILCYTSNDA